MHEAKLEDGVFTEGRIHKKDQPQPAACSLPTFCRWRGSTGLSAEGKTIPTWEDPKAKGFSLHSYGAQFVEVEWEPEIARLRVSRVVTVIDAGRIINPKAAANQIAGAVVMGVGMGLLEETHLRSAHRSADQRQHGRLPDGDLRRLAGDRCDVPRLSRSRDGRVRRARRGRDRAGGRGAAITAAVYHATGVRVRELPVRIENLLESKIAGSVSENRSS